MRRKEIPLLLKESPIFLRIMLLNVILVLFMSLTVQLVFYSLLDNVYTEQFEKYNVSTVLQGFTNIESSIIGNVMEIQKKYFSNTFDNSPIMYPLEGSIYTQPEKILELQRRLSEIEKLKMIHSLDIYYPKTRLIITNTKNLSLSLSDEDFNTYLPWYDKYRSANETTTFISENKLNYPEQQNAFTYVSKLPLYTPQSDMQMVFALHINTDEFDNYLSKNNGLFILLNQDGEIIYDNGFTEISIDEAYFKENIEIFTIDSNYRRMNANGLDAIIVHQQSSSTGLIYAYIIPQKIFYKGYSVFNRLFILMIMIMVILNVVLISRSLKTTDKSYTKKVAIMTKNLGMELPSMNKHLDYALDHLINQIDTMSTEMEMNKPLAWQNMLRSLIFNRITPENYLIIRKKFEHDYVYCGIVDVINQRSYIGQKPSQNVTQLNALFNNQELPFIVDFVSIQFNQFALIVNYPEEHLNKSLYWIKDLITENINDTSVISIGQSYLFNQQSISQSFNEAQEVKKYSYILDNNVLRYSVIEPNKLKNTGTHLKLIGNIARFIEASNLDAAKDAIHKLIVSCTTGRYSIDYCIITLRDLVFEVHSILERNNMDSLIVYGYDIRQYFDTLQNIDCYESWIIGTIEVLLDNMYENTKSYDEELAFRIRELVEQNLENEISLKMISDQMNIRSDTLSKTFKSVVGCNYSDYVKEKKLEYAVNLLKSGDFAIYEIADRLGYRSTQYFIKLFKMKYGLTPKQYQKQNFKSR